MQNGLAFLLLGQVRSFVLLLLLHQEEKKMALVNGLFLVCRWIRVKINGVD